MNSWKPRHHRLEPFAPLWRQALTAVLSLVLLASSGPSFAQARPARQPLAIQEGLSGPVIVLLNDEVDSSRVIRESSVAQPTQVYSRAIRGFAGTLSAAEVQRLALDPRVRDISPDLPVYAQDQTLPTGVNRIDADRNGVAQIDGNDTRVNAGIAILDSGIDAGNEDLNVAGGTDCIGSGNYSDPAGHGTHVAGIAAAKDNGFGTVGVAPGARLYAVKVLTSSLSGSQSNVICGLDWVIGHRNEVGVVNMSFAGTGTSADVSGSCGTTAIHQAICNTVNAGVTVVAAAGNYSTDASSYIPATYPEVIAVSAFADYNGRPGGGAPANCSDSYGDPDDSFAAYSNYGGDVDIVAPGSCIRSSLPGGATGFKSGTSMASPHVAGAAALYLATSPGAGPGAVRSSLLGQAQAQSSAYGISGDPDGAREPVLYVGGGFAPAPTPGPSAPPPTAPPSSGGRTIRGGGGGGVVPPTATPRPGVPVPPQPTTSAPPPTAPPSSGGRTIRGGGGGGGTAPTSTPNVGNPAPPSPGNPTPTPGGSRTIRGSVAGSSVSGDGTGMTESGNRAIRGAATATPTAAVVAAALPTATPVVPTATAVPPTAAPILPTATTVPPTEIPAPPTVTEAPLPTETPLPPTATLEPLPTETPVPLLPTEEPLPTDTPELPTPTPTPSPLPIFEITDNPESGIVLDAIDSDPTTAWYTAAPVSANAEEATPGVETADLTPDEVYLELDLGAFVSIGSVRWSFASLENADQYQVQISSDGTTWETIAYQENALDYEWQELYVGRDARYVRFLFPEPYGDDVLGGLNEVEVYAP